MAGESASVYVLMGYRDAGFQQGMERARAEIAGVGTAATRLVPQLGVLQSALGVGVAGGALLAGARLGSMVADMAQAGAQVERLGDAFADVWGGLGQDSEQALLRLRQASRGTVNDMDLMLAANRAAMLGVSTNVNQLAQLMEIAGLRGRAMGLSMSQAFNDIVTGLGRMSPLILDNLGITVDMEAAAAEYARQLGRTANSLTETERKQALLNAVLKQGARELKEAGDVALGAAGQFDRLAVSRQNFINSLNEDVAQRTAPLAASLASVFDVLQSGSEEALARTAATFDQYLAQSRARADEAVRAFGVAGKEMFDLIRPKQLDIDQWRALREAQNDAARELDNFNRLMGQMDSGAVRDMAYQVEGLAEAFAELNGVSQLSLLGLGQELGGEVAYAMDRVAEAVAAGNISLADGITLWNEYRDAYSNFLGFVAGNSPEGITDPESALMARVGMETERQGLLDRLGLGKKAVRSGISDAQREAEAALRELRGVVEGVLRPTFTGDPTGLLDQMGLHIDTADEDARRLASVMAEGLSSEWTAYFAQRGLLSAEDLADDDTARAAAARVLREFQLGLRPELVDKETAKERVKELLLGQQRTDQLVNEIMQELGAEGVQASRQQIRLALGDTTAAAPAAQAAQQVVQTTVQETVVALNLAPPTTQQLEQWRVDTTGIQFDAFPFLVPPSEDNARYWRESLALGIQFNAWPYLGPPSVQDSDQWRANVSGIMFNATPYLAALTVDEKLGWRTGAEGIQFDAAPVLAPPSTAQGLYWRAAAEVLTFDAAPLLWAPLQTEKDTWRANATGIMFDAVPMLAGLTADEKQGWRNDLVSALTDGLSITGPLSLAIATDFGANGDATLGLDAKEYAGIWAGYFLDGIPAAGYVSTLAEAMANDFGANATQLAPVARAVGQYVGVVINDELKRNVNIVQGVVDAAIEQMAAGLIDQAQGGE